MSEMLHNTTPHHVFEDTGQGVLFNAEASRITEYKILQGHKLEDGSMKSQEQLLRQYVTNTDRLIGKLDGTIENEPPYDAVIFLDKSARPVAWLMAELWPIVARKHGELYDKAETPELPSRYFLNIDREQWLPIIDPDHTGTYNLEAIPVELIQSLRAIYQPLNSATESKTVLEGKKVLIVDEVGVTGSTLKIAAQLLEKAIPEATFDTAHWMNPGVFTDSNGSRNNDLPVWYKQHDARGRGVADRDFTRSADSNSQMQKDNPWWLSTRFDKPDEESLQLRAEFKQLVNDLLSHKILYTPCPQRDIEDTINRIEAVNEISIKEYQYIKSQDI